MSTCILDSTDRLVSLDAHKSMSFTRILIAASMHLWACSINLWRCVFEKPIVAQQTSESEMICLDLHDVYSSK
jgi:hypothetical protein